MMKNKLHACGATPTGDGGVNITVEGFGMFDEYQVKKQIFSTRDWNTPLTTDYIVKDPSVPYTPGAICDNPDVCYNHPWFANLEQGVAQVLPGDREIWPNRMPHLGSCLFQTLFTAFPWPTNGLEMSKYTPVSTPSRTIQECQRDCIMSPVCEVWTLLFDPTQTHHTNTCFLQVGEVLEQYASCFIDQEDRSLVHNICGNSQDPPLCSVFSGASISGMKVCDPTMTPTQGWLASNWCAKSPLDNRVVTSFDANFASTHLYQPSAFCGLPADQSEDGQVCLKSPYMGYALIPTMAFTGPIAVDWNIASSDFYVYTEESTVDWENGGKGICDGTGCLNHAFTETARGRYQIVPEGAPNHQPHRGNCLTQFAYGDYPWGINEPMHSHLGKYTIQASLEKEQQSCQQACYRTEGCELWTYVTDSGLVTLHDANCFLQSQDALDTLKLPTSDPGCVLANSDNYRPPEVAKCQDNSTEICSAYHGSLITGRRLCDETTTPTLSWQQANSLCTVN